MTKEQLKKELEEKFDKNDNFYFYDGCGGRDYDSRDEVKSFLYQAIDQAWNAGVEAVKLEHKFEPTEVGNITGYYFKKGYNQAVDDLEDIKEELTK